MNLKSYSWLSLFLVFIIFIATTQTQISHVQDLDFIYHQVKNNHPGMYNELDPTFKDNLEQAYHNAQKLINKTTDKKVQKQVIDNFTDHFDDIHLRIRWKNNTKNSQNNTTNLFASKLIIPEIAWITLPTFFKLTDEQQNSFNQLLEELPLFRKKSTIVFDLRGNPGGNSAYAQQILKELFGQQYAQQQINIASQNTFVDWRASKENLLHVKRLQKQYNLDSFKQITKGITKSIETNNPYYQQKSCQASKTNLVNNPVTAHIIVIIDQVNKSSALRFIDFLYMMEQPVTLVGKTTASDRLYTEVRSVQLPSGSGSLLFPIKVFRNRTRGDNQPYKPDFEQDTDSIQKLKFFITNFIKTR